MMRLITLLALFAAAAAPALAQNCGNPCEDGYVWTDRNMGMCVPAPPPPEKPTS